MNTEELSRAIESAGATNQYSVRTSARPDERSSDVTVVEPAADGSGRWVVYYTERGSNWDPVYFDSEDAACDYVYARLTETPPPARRLSADEQQQAAQRSEELEQKRRQMLRELGIDPETGQPLAGGDGGPPEG